jgi:hypothetical protein
MDPATFGQPGRLACRGKFAGNQVGQGLVVEVLVDAGVPRRTVAPAPQGAPTAVSCSGVAFHCRIKSHLMDMTNLLG